MIVVDASAMVEALVVRDADSDLLDALVEAVSTRSSEADPAVVRAAQDLAVASLD